MDDNIRKLSEYIDKLNAEQRPDQHGRRRIAGERRPRSTPQDGDPALPGDCKGRRAVRNKRVKTQEKVLAEVWQRSRGAGNSGYDKHHAALRKVHIVYAMEQASEVEATMVS